MANFDTQLAVFTLNGCEIDSNAVLMGANEDGPKNCATAGDSYLTIKNLTAGQKYYLVVDGYGGNRGSFNIVLKDQITPGPVNDDVANAIELPVDGEVKSGYTNAYATVRDGEQNIRPVPVKDQDCTTGWCDEQVDNSVWYKFVTPVDGKVNISTCDLADFDTQLALYSATNVSDFSTFTLKAANDAGPADCSTYFDSYLPVTGLTAGQTYYIMVDGFDGDNGAFSISLTGVADIKAPTEPTATTAGTTTETTAQVSWTAATDNVGVDQYEVFVDGESVGKTGNTSFTITGLTGSKTYAVTIVALDAAGNKSGTSTSVSVTTKAAPDSEAPSSPTGLTAAEIRTTGIDISWNASTDNVGVKEYKVYVDGSLAATVTGTNFSLSGLTAGTAYSIYVTAIDAAGNISEASTALKVTTATGAVVDTEAPSTPSGLVASEISDSGILVSWDASTDNVAVSSYEIYVDGVLNGSSSDTRFIISGLTKLTAYSIQVLANDVAGNASALSSALKVTTVEESTLSVIEFDKNGGYQVYPNPFGSEAYLKFPEKSLAEESVQVVDASGKSVLRPKMTKVENGLVNLDLGNLSPGTHFLIIKTERGMVYKRLMKH